MATRRQMLYDMANSVPEPEPAKPVCGNEDGDGDGGDEAVVFDDDEEEEAVVSDDNEEAVVSDDDDDDDDEAVISDNDEAIVSDDDEAVVSDDGDEAVVSEDDDEDARVIGNFGICSTYASNRVESVHSKSLIVMNSRRLVAASARWMKSFGAFFFLLLIAGVFLPSETYERHGQPSMMNTLDHLEEQLELHKRSHKQTQDRLEWLTKNSPDDDEAME